MKERIFVSTEHRVLCTDEVIIGTQYPPGAVELDCYPKYLFRNQLHVKGKKRKYTMANPG